jgi:hypothetical protein
MNINLMPKEVEMAKEKTTIETKTVKIGDKEALLDAIAEMLEAFGFEDMLLIASKDKGKPFASMLRATDGVKAVAVAGMGVKIVAEELGTRSDEVAEIIRKNLEEAENKVAELERKDKKVRKIVVE